MIGKALFTAASLGLLALGGCATTGEGASTATTTTSATTAPTPAAPPAATPAPSASASAASGAGAEILQRACTACHGAEIITTQKKTSAEWRATIDDMVTRGAVVSDSEANTLQAYLAATHGA
jgi:cytochrome c5